jgi:cytoskeleton protein RodZ
VQSSWPDALASPGYWLAGLLLIAAIAVFFLPPGWLGGRRRGTRPASAPAASATEVEPGMRPGRRRARRHAPRAARPRRVGGGRGAGAGRAAGRRSTASAPRPAVAATRRRGASSSEDGAMPAGMSNCGRRRRRGSRSPMVAASRSSRAAQAGRGGRLDGRAPFRVRIGNAAGRSWSIRGQPMDLKAFTRDNVARLELR